jgi:hypothetical protein
MLLTRSDFTPILLCLQGGLGEFSLLKGHIFERMCQVASTPVPSEQVRGEPEWSGSPQRRVNLDPIYGIIKQQN